MKKTLTIAFGIMLLTFISSLVLAESGLDVATPAAKEQNQERSSDKTDTNIQSLPDNVSISKHNKAMLEVEQQKELRQDQITKERAAEAAPQ